MDAISAVVADVYYKNQRFFKSVFLTFFKMTIPG